jgi:hypothetical protein
MNVSGIKVAIIGDSHTQTMPGIELAKLLTSAGARVTNIGIGATSVPQWIADPTCQPTRGGCVQPPKNKIVRVADEVAKAGGFDLVIVSLGTNDGANASAAGRPKGIDADAWPAKVASAAKRVASNMFFMGPPKMRGNVKHYTDANIKPYFDAAKNFFGNAAIDGYGPTAAYAATEGDGVHYYGTGGKKWAKVVFDAVTTRAPYSLSATVAPAPPAPPEPVSPVNPVAPPVDVKPSSPPVILLAVAAIAAIVLVMRRR